MSIDPKRAEAALRELIADLDYDLHKQLECDEETGADSYPRVASGFIRNYNETSK